MEYNGRELTVRGPITPGLRKNLADTWAHWPQMRPHSAPQRQAARAALEAAGQPLSESQQKAFEKAFDALWTPAQLRAALDIAGVPAPKEKTACECFADQQNGVNPIERQVPPTTPAVVLNPEQIAVLERLAFDPAIAEADFLAELQKAGPLTPAQVAAFSKFLRAAPTVGTFERDLYFSLRQEGPLTKQQQDQLLGNFQKEFQWRQGVGELFAAAHVPKYPWSGDYTEPGTPFWWVYLYILQPLMTSTFAMLAFYVASAAFRAFRAKNLEATLLLITAFIVLLRSTPLGAGLSSLLPESLAFLKLDAMTAFIMKVPNTAGNRAIMIGIALGIAATSLKVLLGLDRSYLGSDD